MRMSSFASNGWLGIALSAPLLLVLLFCPYFIPGPDETYQVQAATQLRIGNGYVSANNAEPKTLDHPGLTRVLGWPIAYSASLSALERVGFSPSAAGKTFEILVILVGMLSWAWLMRSCGLAPVLSALFLPLLWLQFLSWGVYSTNAFTWALLPLLLGLGTRVHRGSVFALAAGSLCALLVVFRYQNIVLIPGGALAILLSVPATVRKRIGLAALYCVPPTLSFIAIFLSNKASSGGQHGTFLSQIPVQIGWEWRWVADFFSAFFLGASFRLDDVFLSIARKLGHEERTGLLKYSVAIPLGIVFFYTLVRGFLRDFSAARRTFPLFSWVMCNLAGLLGMLFGLAIVLHVDNIPIGRYYHPFLPAAVLLLLLYLQPSLLAFLARFGERAQEKIMVVALVGGLLVSAGFSFYRFKLSRSFEERVSIAAKLMENARLESPSSPVLVFADQLFPHFAPRDDLNTLIYPDIFRRNAELVPENSVLVFLVNDEANPKPQYPPISDIRSLASKHGMKVAEESGVTVAWKVFGPGK